MENFKQKIVAMVILILVVGGLVWLTMFLKNKNIDTQTGEKTGISLFTKKNTGTKQVKNQGSIGNQNTTDFTGNDTTKPVSIIENIIQTITGNGGGSNNNTNTTDSNAVSVNQGGGIGQAIRNFFLGNDGLPTGGNGNSVASSLNDGGVSPAGVTGQEIPGIDLPVEVLNLTGDDIPRAECSPAVYVSKLTRKQDLELQIKLGIKKLETLTDEEQEFQKWKPTKLEQDEDDMKRVLHRYWDVWSYPDNYLKPEGGECGTWSDNTTTESDFFKQSADNITVNENTINNAKREVRKSFSALSTIVSSTFSVNQSEGQRLIAQNDNLRYDDLLNDCRVIRGQFEGGYTYAPDGKTRITIGQYYYPNAQSGTAFIANSHEKIAEDLARRVKLAPKPDTELGRLIEKSKKAKMGTGPELTDAEIIRYQELMLTQKFGRQEELGGIIRSEIIKSSLINWSDDTNILTATEMGNISYLWDKNNPPQTEDFWIPKNKAENMGVFSSFSNSPQVASSGQPGSQVVGLGYINPGLAALQALGAVNVLGGNITKYFSDYVGRFQNEMLSTTENARYHLTMYPKLQYGGALGFSQLRGSTFWSKSQYATNPNPGFYLIKEPQSIWEILEQDRDKVLYCRLNKFMSMWAGIETNEHPVRYINSHGINCDNKISQEKLNLITQTGGWSESERLAWVNRHLDNQDGNTKFRSWVGPKIILERSNQFWPSHYYYLEDRVTMPEFMNIDRDNWYSNSPQNAIFEFIKDED
jgi:hypothetical protein